jgi:hypothetical protein
MVKYQEYICPTAAGFIQQITYYFSRGYYYYSHSRVGDGKDLLKVDDKITRLYPVKQDKFHQSRSRKLGHSVMRYLRYGQDFILFATPGSDIGLFSRENNFDIRKQGLEILNHHIFVSSFLKKETRESVRKVHVSMAREVYKGLTAWAEENAQQKNISGMLYNRIFKELNLEPWGGVRKQIFTILKKVNVKRHNNGWETIAMHVPLRKSVPVWSAAQDTLFPGFQK